MNDLVNSLNDFFVVSGIYSINLGSILMITIACILLFLAISKGFEPLLLIPIGFGMLLSNLPNSSIFGEGGLINFFYYGVKTTKNSIYDSRSYRWTIKCFNF